MSGWPTQSLEVQLIFDRGVMGLWPTQGDETRLLFSNDCRWRHRPPLCHLDRSVPGFPTSLLLATTTSAALCIESRMQIINATDLDRKSGGAQWRDLRFSGPFLEMFVDRGCRAALKARKLPRMVVLLH